MTGNAVGVFVSDLRAFFDPGCNVIGSKWLATPTWTEAAAYRACGKRKLAL